MEAETCEELWAGKVACLQVTIEVARREKILGSPDPYGRQLDGLGAGISSLSKIAVVAQSKTTDTDVDYTFYGVGIKTDEVDSGGNCGNLSAAIGPYAFEHDLTDIKPAADGSVTIRISNTNTGKIIRSTFQTIGDEAEVHDDFPIDGVPGTGSQIKLEFISSSGAKTGKLLTTGNFMDIIEGVKVSCVDVGNPCVFVSSQDMRIAPGILPDAILGSSDLLKKLESLRLKAAILMGIISEGQDTPRTVPKLGLVSPSTLYQLLSGRIQEAKDVDVLVQFISDRQPHRAIPLTGAICTAAAAGIRGSVVQERLAKEAVTAGTVTIGHASGRIPVTSSFTETRNLESVTVYRTARRLFEGEVFYT